MGASDVTYPVRVKLLRSYLTYVPSGEFGQFTDPW